MSVLVLTFVNLGLCRMTFANPVQDSGCLPAYRTCKTGTAGQRVRHVGHVQLKDKALREGKVLPSHHPASASVLRVGTRIADKADDSFGGGFTSHMQVSALISPQVF